MSLHPIETATAETLLDYEILDDFDEMLEIDEFDDAPPGSVSETTHWLREFRFN